MILRELGAEVIKIEFRESGDACRTIPPITDGGEGYIIFRRFPAIPVVLT